MFRRKLFWAVVVAVLVPVLGVAWWLVSPLFLTVTVKEDFPMAEKAVVPENMTRSEVENVLAGMAKTSQEKMEAMSETMTAAAKIKVGSFRDADAFHRGSGQATIYRLEDGSLVLRLENLNVTNGPGLHVLLARHANPERNSDVKDVGFVELARLKGNVGDQNYPIPAEVDVAAHKSVVIYCKPFQVIFSVASLQDQG